MQIYYHCTYKLSPVGFRIGKLSFDRKPTDSMNMELSEENLNQFIQECFEHGTVSKACGVLPQEPSKHFLLAKKLTAQGKTPDEPEYYSIDLALVADNKDQFASWLEEGADTEQDIAEAVKDSMEITRSGEFGYTVRAEKAALLAEKSFKSLFDGCDLRAAESETCVETSFTQTDLSKLTTDLGLSNQDKEFQKLEGHGKWVSYSKKKRTFLGRVTTLVGRIKARIGSLMERIKRTVRSLINMIKENPVLSIGIGLVLLIILSISIYNSKN